MIEATALYVVAAFGVIVVLVLGRLLHIALIIIEGEKRDQ